MALAVSRFQCTARVIRLSDPCGADRYSLRVTLSRAFGSAKALLNVANAQAQITYLLESPQKSSPLDSSSNGDCYGSARTILCNFGLDRSHICALGSRDLECGGDWDMVTSCITASV